MYALNPDFSTSETTPSADSQRNHHFTSGRELEFQSALENYLSDYRLSIDAHNNRVGSAPTSAIHKFLEWFRRQRAINRENPSYRYNYGQHWRNDGNNFQHAASTQRLLHQR
jgi:hypothetical protein